MYVFLFLTFLNSIIWSQTPSNQRDDLIQEEYEILKLEEIQENNHSFLYLKLAPRGMNSGRDCLGCPLSSLKREQLMKFAISSLGPSAVATHRFLYTDTAKDKWRHFSAGFVAGSLTSGTLQLLIPKNKKHRQLYAFLGGVGASIIIGAGKEYWDSLGHGQVEFKDAMATVAGGVSGGITINLYDLIRK